MATRSLRILSLCSGVGMLDYAAKLASERLRTSCYVEIESYRQSVLQARMQDGSLDSGPIWDDVRTFNAREWEFDGVIAGFPCQAFSTASRGRQREQRNLWPDVASVLRDARARWVFLENVATIRAYLPTVGSDLAAMGYRLMPPLYCSSADLGAVDDRKRVFVFAYTDSESESSRAVDEEVASLSGVAEQGYWHEAPSCLMGVDDGSTARVDRLRALGDGVNVIQAAAAFTLLARRAGVAL